MTRARGLLLVGFLIALVLAGGASYYASTNPDGLTRVAEQEGFAGTASDHPLADSPVADYEVRGVDGGFAGGLAGVIGVVATFAVGGLVFRVLRRRALRDDPIAPAPAPATDRGGDGPGR